MTGVCIPEKHYMADTGEKLKEITAKFIEPGNYFTINCARQYGKTTTLYLLEQSLKEQYTILRLSFESADDLFVSRYTFAPGLVKQIGKRLSQTGMDISFHSVILTGVYDVKNLKLKLHPEEETKYNSPWNIAADFHVDMSLSVQEIAGMLTEYEKDHSTGMDIQATAQRIYAHTSGYPYLVSRLCKRIAEDVGKTDAWPDEKE